MISKERKQLSLLSTAEKKEIPVHRRYRSRSLLPESQSLQSI